MSIQHEIAEEHKQQQLAGTASRNDDGGVWTLMKYVDLVRLYNNLDSHLVAIRSLRARRGYCSSAVSR